jgi:hypothetical protein
MQRELGGTPKFRRTCDTLMENLGGTPKFRRTCDTLMERNAARGLHVLGTYYDKAFFGDKQYSGVLPPEQNVSDPFWLFQDSTSWLIDTDDIPIKNPISC